MTGELLKRFNVFRSTDRARSQEQLSRSLCPHTLTMRGEEPIETVQSLAPLASSQLVYIEYSGPIAVSRARIDDYYLLLLPHRGPSEVTVDGRAVVLQPGRGTIIPAGRGFGVRCDQGVSALIWRIPREALEAQVDDRVRVYGRAIDFDLLLALDAGPGAALSRALHYAAAELDANGSLLGSARAMERFEQSLMLALIDCQMSEAGIPVNSYAAIRPRLVSIGSKNLSTPTPATRSRRRNWWRCRGLAPGRCSGLSETFGERLPWNIWATSGCARCVATCCTPAPTRRWHRSQRAGASLSMAGWPHRIAANSANFPPKRCVADRQTADRSNRP